MFVYGLHTHKLCFCMGLCCHLQITMWWCTAFILKVTHALNRVSQIRKILIHRNYNSVDTLWLFCCFIHRLFSFHFCLKTTRLKSNWSPRLSKCIFQSRYRRESIWSKSTRRHNCLWVSEATLFCLMKQTNHKSPMIGQCGLHWLNRTSCKKTKMPISQENIRK